MPRTLAFCPSRLDLMSMRLGACRAQGGFTLLELLVVLALVALIAGLVAPVSLRGLDAARERGLASDLEAELAGLPVLAFRSGEALTLDAQQLRARLPDLPDDWTLSVEPPLRYGSSGMASGAEVSLLAPGRAKLRWRVAGLTGEVSRLP